MKKLSESISLPPDSGLDEALLRRHLLEVSQTARRVYSYLRWVDVEKQGFAYPRISIIAQRIGSSERQVIRCIEVLEDRGLIQVLKRHKRNFYLFLRPPALDEKSSPLDETLRELRGEIAQRPDLYWQEAPLVDLNKENSPRVVGEKNNLKTKGSEAFSKPQKAHVGKNVSYSVRKNVSYSVKSAVREKPPQCQPSNNNINKQKKKKEKNTTQQDNEELEERYLTWLNDVWEIPSSEQERYESLLDEEKKKDYYCHFYPYPALQLARRKLAEELGLSFQEWKNYSTDLLDVKGKKTHNLLTTCIRSSNDHGGP